MKVHCYYEEIPGNGAAPVLDYWKKTWSEHGWEPVVLGEADFLKLPFSGALDFQARRLPTFNGHLYERACYRRWLAMAGVGGGFMSDYDVINFGFKPGDLPPSTGRLQRFNREAPCAVHGTMWNFLQAVDMFLSYAAQPDDLCEGKMLVQDMTILNRYSHVQDFYPACTEWIAGELNNSPLVHFCHARAGVNKEKAIESFLALKNGASQE